MTTNKDLLCGQRVLEEEAQGLLSLKQALNDEFVKALDVISSAKGRVIITGMGKSGHIARKMAATFSSTWTPAFFVHPGEASHGDLGMIKRGDDVIIALSFSGSAPELSDTIEFAKRFSVPLIAITGNKDSVLARKADILLLLPSIKEACPNNQAPTTSTTMMLALGDALAVALLERQKITADQFKVFHPGGKLGKPLLRVKDVMNGKNNIPFIKPDASMDDVIEGITKGTLGCVCVSNDNQKLLGVITDGDIRRYAREDFTNMKAEDVMTANPSVVAPNDLGAEAMALFNEKNITNVPVVEEDRVVGILHIHDCLQAALA